MLPRLMLYFFILGTMLVSSTCSLSSATRIAPPIVYTIAGSDSGGGAGIQADLHAIHAMKCHGCSAITCLTAQNSVGVTSVHAPPASFLKAQLEALTTDLPPYAVKIGMLGNDPTVAETVGAVLQEFCKNNKDGNNNNKVWIVLDPVMISTSGHKLINDEAKAAMIQHVCPYADIITPNKFEAEAFLGRKLTTTEDIEKGAEELLHSLGCKAVLIKGGHTLMETQKSTEAEKEDKPSKEVQATLQYAQDYLLSSENVAKSEDDVRLCDGNRGVWMRTRRWDSKNTHGTGCTLSSSIASALALGEQKRRQTDQQEGATSAMDVVDACCLAKAYVAAGIQRGVQLGQGPGPVAHTEFPSTHEHYPSIVKDPTTTASTSHFPTMMAYRHQSISSDDTVPTLGRILPIVDTVEWVERLAKTPGVTDIQLRIKDKEIIEDYNLERKTQKIVERVTLCQKLCEKAGVRLWINDFWEAALVAGCFGVHLGQEDLCKCEKEGGLDQLREKSIALGISTHSYAELAVALGIQPSYISMGPVFGTSSKKVAFDLQGLGIVAKWRELIPPSIPFVTIGGIGTAEIAKQNREAGADCVAVIGAVTLAQDVAAIVSELNDAMS